jgi:polysaccharide biosynthesis/export protein
MPRRYCLREQPNSRGRRALRVAAAAMLVIGAASLSGCAGSSGNTVAMNGGAGDSAAAPAYASDGSVTADSSASAFAPTGPAVHSAAASRAADVLTAVAKPGNAAYKIGPLDLLNISVFKVPDLTKDVQVAADGTINYPLIGDVPAAGKTAQQLEHDLTAKLGAKYLRNPQVTVMIKEYNSQRITVSGAVKTSGVYAIKGNTSLMQVIAMAGDVDTTTDSGNVVVFRMIDGQRSAARFDIDAIRAGKASDPEVEPGDVVVVDSSSTKVAFHNIISALPIATTAAIFSGL